MRRYSEEKLRNLFKGKKILVVSYEAGAGQVLSSLIKKIMPEKISYVLDGPALDIFKAKLPGIKNNILSEKILKGADIIITGTSLIPELEREAVAMAKREGKYCISVIDHWVHYTERFIPVAQKGRLSRLENYLPDEIWVTDDYAWKTALNAGLPENKLSLMDNLYLADTAKKMAVGKSDSIAKDSVLYICEPVYEDVLLLYGDGNAWGYNEYDLVNDIMKNLHLFENNFKRLIIRLHPNEKTEKYNELLSGYAGRINIEVTSCKNTSLEEDCRRSEYVIGVESMALVIALMSGKKVFSCLPKKAKKFCALPHREIVHINSFKEIANFIGGAH
jgi:hypothetical protein